MPVLGAVARPNITSSSTIIDHKEYLGGHADTISNPGYYTFYAHYTPGNVSVIVRGINMASSDYTATSGKDILISTSAITLNSDDTIQIIGYGTSTSSILTRSDMNITGGQAINLEKVDSKMYMNRNEYSANLHVPAGYNAFFAGPMNFTGTLTIDGVLNII